MVRALLGIAIATVVLYFWGFLFWVVLPFQSLITLAPPDAAAARGALREQFPADGTYIMPEYVADQEVMLTRYREGPVAIIHMLSHEGRTDADMNVIMLGGFLLDLVVVALIAAILSLAARPRYWQRVQLCGVMGLAAALLINYGGVVWWQISRPWELYSGAYHFTFFLLAGVILGAFVKPKQAAEEKL